MIEQQLPKNAFQLIWRSLKEWDGAWSVWLNLCIMPLQTAAILAVSFVIGQIITISQANEVISWALFYDPLLLFLGLGLFISACFYVDELCWRAFEPKWQIYIKQKLFSYLQDRSYGFFVNTHSGRVAQKIYDVAFNGMVTMDWSLYKILPVFCTAIIGSAFLFIGNAILGLFSALFLACFIWVAIQQGRTCGNLAKRHYNVRSKVTGHFVDSISNNGLVRLFGRRLYEKQLLKHAMVPYEASGWSLYSYQISMFVAAALLSYGYGIITAALMLHFFIMGETSIAQLSVQFSILLLILNSILRLSFDIRMLGGSIGTVNEGLEFLSDPLEAEHNAKKQMQTADLTIHDGRIDIENLSFSYPNGQQLFKDFNLQIRPGQRIGLIGPSGAGKSSLVNLLLRLYEPQSGQITIDNQPIQNADEDDLRRFISIIPQDTTLFHRSLMDNIRYGDLDATDEEVIIAARKAHAHEFITNLPNGYDTMVGERGVKLSGGQRQRIAIARAILKDAPILILDEATSALDSESERFIQDSLKELMQGKTVIAIAHRLSTIAHLDHLIILKEGKIIETGSHSDLIDQDGLYAKLWSMQSDGFLQEDDSA